MSFQRRSKESVIRGVSDGAGGLKTTITVVDGMVYVSFPANESYGPSSTGKSDLLAQIDTDIEMEDGNVHVSVIAYKVQNHKKWKVGA